MNELFSAAFSDCEILALVVVADTAVPFFQAETSEPKVQIRELGESINGVITYYLCLSCRSRGDAERLLIRHLSVVSPGARAF